MTARFEPKSPNQLNQIVIPDDQNEFFEMEALGDLEKYQNEYSDSNSSRNQKVIFDSSIEKKKKKKSS